MAFGRPRRRNDPSVMASVEAAISTVARVIIPTWPGLDRAEAEGGDDEEPALHGSPGHYRPFG
jgi:hypothetical protein